MYRFIYIIIMFILIGCNKNRIDTDVDKSLQTESIIKDDVLLKIIKKIIEKNEPFQQLQISLLDLDDMTIMQVQIDDVLNSCDSVKGVFKLNDINIIIKYFSKKHNFDFLFDTSIYDRINVCDSLLNEFVGPHDPITYNFRLWEKGYITYPNGDSLIYSKEGIKLNDWK